MPKDPRGYTATPRLIEEPYTRVGLCCGERCMKKRARHDVALYLVRRSRYRCAGCFKVETGHNP